jgi:carbonic anhydrase
VAPLVDELLARNRRWAEAMEANDVDFFRRLEAQQRPRVLWIGCSDSRVPATQITDLPPGEMFVHRNVANVVSPADPNLLAVLEFGLEALDVRELIVCGHYGCGGVAAVLDGRATGRVASWLAPVAELAHRHGAELEALGDAKRANDRLCELNVRAQVASLWQTAPVAAARRAGRELAVHGWIYRVSDGRLHDLDLAQPPGLRAAAPDAEPIAATSGGDR